MTVLAQSRGLADSAVPGETVASEVAVGSTAGRLLRFAIANIARRPDRFLLATAGIALAVMAVTVVRTVSVSFARSGSDSLTTVLRGAPLWVVPAQGVHYDPGISMLTSDGPPPAVRAYDADELYAAGKYPYQCPVPQGLPEYVAGDASVVDTDVVVWYTVGAHHVVRPEDWPVMPVARTGFELKPVGFFDGNPALDLPESAAACHHHHGGPDLLGHEQRAHEHNGHGG